MNTSKVTLSCGDAARPVLLPATTVTEPVRPSPIVHLTSKPVCLLDEVDGRLDVDALPSAFGMRGSLRVHRAAPETKAERARRKRNKRQPGVMVEYQEGWMWQKSRLYSVEELLANITHSPEFRRPEGLNEDGSIAYRTIMQTLPRVTPHPECARRPDLADACGCTIVDCYSGGCTVFREPANWEASGERYGGDSVLIVVYDGGEVGSHFKFGDDDRAATAMWESLGAHNLYFEECTHWYGAIYRNRARED